MSRRTIPEIPKETLQKLYIDDLLSLDEIARTIGVSATYVCTKLREHDIPRRSVKEATNLYFHKEKEKLDLMEIPTTRGKTIAALEIKKEKEADELEQKKNDRILKYVNYGKELAQKVETLQLEKIKLEQELDKLENDLRNTSGLNPIKKNIIKKKMEIKDLEIQDITLQLKEQVDKLSEFELAIELVEEVEKLNGHRDRIKSAMNFLVALSIDLEKSINTMFDKIETRYKDVFNA